MNHCENNSVMPKIELLISDPLIDSISSPQNNRSKPLITSLAPKILTRLSASTSPTTKTFARSPPAAQHFDFHPTLSKKSLFLASLQKSPKQRLLQSSEKSLTPEKLSFIPTINKRSSRLTLKLRGSAQKCWDILYKDSIEKKNKNDLQRKIFQENEINDKECTFRPLVSSTLYTEEDFITRSEHWLRNKHEKLIGKLEEDINKGFEECTFIPETCKTSAEKHKRVKAVKGIEGFLKRFPGKSCKSSVKKHHKRNLKRDMTAKEYKSAVEVLNEYLHTIDISYSNIL